MSIIGEILAEAKRKGYINFGPGLPDPSVFPLKEIREILSEIRAEYLNYSPYDGLDELKEEVLRFLEKRGIENREVIITSGAQEAIALVALYLRGRGVRMGNPTFLEALSAFRTLGASVSPAYIDENGEVPDIADAFYVIPTGHNPTGYTMSLERREAFAQLSDRVLIVEDAAYELIYYDKYRPPIASLTDKSIYIFSFSKIIAPGLRIGVLAVPEGIKEELLKLRSILNICAPTESQFLVLELLRRGVVEKNAEKARELYKRKRDLLVKELKPVLEFSEPKGGFFLWTRFPIDAFEFLEKVKEQGVVFVPGRDFYITKPDLRSARLSFSYETPERISEGAKIIRETLEEL